MNERAASGEIEASQGGLALAFEGWADLSARLMGLGQEERLDILDAREVDVEDWTRCDEHYCLALAGDVARGVMDRAKIYGLKCATEIERRKTEGAAPELLARPAAESEPPPREPDQPVEAAPIALPSFLQPQQALAAAAPVPAAPVH